MIPDEFPQKLISLEWVTAKLFSRRVGRRETRFAGVGQLEIPFAGEDSNEKGFVGEDFHESGFVGREVVDPEAAAKHQRIIRVT